MHCTCIGAAARIGAAKHYLLPIASCPTCIAHAICSLDWRGAAEHGVRPMP